MLLFPAIDLYDHKVVRLLKGDYQKMTVYSDDPVRTAQEIEAKGASWLHLVDLEGAKDGTTPNFDVVEGICQKTDLQVEIGGGIRSLDTIERYLKAGVARVILGTKAVTDPLFLRDALAHWGEQIAVGVDAKEGKVAVKGWMEVLDVDMFDFLGQLRDLGVKTAIVTDISRDGAMKGTNLPLYERLSRLEGIDITASGGVSTLDDLRALREMKLYGAILGKAMYNGAVSLEDALRLARG
ncbi:MAG TPA: 1-(5-phosphoribosyl)-5-[(5-phosphoribosylamino)methylideneamino]imidazole-4-carboxamide isomerase [Oribacterium sp.]|nr:1-(5-phosphoribosyl)-5-[(5-phosphoribosylamino)methylideneamino]imidazole-4-carboxamide isomerase [Oribacterium sp.]HCS67364.1 1-(5-phosphoribosyl)-5-[(5-phosphoribosylamino)methylideneamino]imidazole-4-carboxamide isomerase [Oribacterium sp.]